MKVVKLDLHCHSIHSDGLWSVEQLIQDAVKKRLKLLSVTDHDTIEGSKELLSKKEPPTMSFIPGIEINTGEPKTEEYHVLGYFIEMDEDTPLNKRLMELQQARRQRIIKMTEILASLGYEISMSEVLSRPEAKKGSVGRPIIARILVEKGYFPDIQTVFDELLTPGKPAYVPREKITTEEAIKLILNSGGIPVLAHPFFSFETWEKLEADIKKFYKAGLKGVEYYYPYTINYPETISFKETYNPNLLELINELGLIKTAGSDFHGDRGILGTKLPAVDLCRLYELKGERPPEKLKIKCEEM